jgi:hypothetical protein
VRERDCDLDREGVKVGTCARDIGLLKPFSLLQSRGPRSLLLQQMLHCVLV